MTGHAARRAGTAAMVGGALWLVATIHHATKPIGCDATPCSRPLREGGFAFESLFLLSLALFGVGLFGVVDLMRREGSFGWLARMAAAVGATGAALVATAIIAQGVFFDDFSLMPWFLLPGGSGILLALVLFGIAVIHSRLLPVWVSVLLLISTAAMGLYNEQTTRVLFGIPLGIAWIALGYSLRRRAALQSWVGPT